MIRRVSNDKHMKMVRRANISLFSIDAIETAPITTNPALSKSIKMTELLGYTLGHPLYFDICQLNYCKITEQEIYK